MKHPANAKFWKFHEQLPKEIQKLAGENFDLLKHEPRHPSLHFKKVGRMWSARVGIHYRAVAVEDDGEMIWFWIGHHSEYDRLIRSDLNTNGAKICSSNDPFFVKFALASL